jgi:hypothetical protein
VGGCNPLFVRDLVRGRVVGGRRNARAYGRQRGLQAAIPAWDRAEAEVGGPRGSEPFAEKPARLRLTSRQSKPLVLMVLPHRITPMWSEDVSARDDAVTAINAALDA